MKFEKELRSLLSGNAVILGMGNELKADDGAGVVLARRLIADLNSSKRITIISAGSSPENYIRNILAAEPDAIIFIDAADTGGSPGKISLHGAGSLLPSPPSTHSISPGMIMKMLSFSSQSKIRLLAIQPKTLALNGGISPEVERSINWLEKTIVEAVKNSQRDLSKE
ncbi:MAG: hydrogenase maturation protease [Candidatus Tritonobacter lacicola]|nr:hydrogenase maturation protease [Candidatus Tritonobacter lacicola]